MDWLNFQHLLYFWTVAREGTVTAASTRLGLAQPTISAQIRLLERSLGVELFRRVGRRLELTDVGKIAYRYADEIFSLGTELRETIRGGSGDQPLRLHVGISDVIPKLVAFRLLAPAMAMRNPIRIVCTEGKADQLLSQLAIHDLDVVLTDAPVGPTVSIRAYNHLLGECPVVIFAAPNLVNRYRRKFPRSLDGAPWILPTSGTMLRRALDQWFDARNIRPTIVGEFEDSALAKVFGQQGVGLFAAPSIIQKEICRQYNVRAIGQIDSIREQFYAISVERRIRNPGVAALADLASKRLFRGS